MNLLPAALVRPVKQVSKTQAHRRPGPEVNTVAAAALGLLAVAGAFLIGEAYLSRAVLTVDERYALLSTLLTCDVLVIGFAALATAVVLYFYPDRYGERRSLLSLWAPALYGSILFLPIVFIASDLAFKPAYIMGFEVEISLALSLLGIVALGSYILDLLDYARPGRILSRHLREIQREFIERDGPAGRAALQRPVLRGDAGLAMASTLDKLLGNGDSEPALRSLEDMRNIALKDPKSPRDVSLAGAMVALIGETASIAARQDNQEVMYHAVDETAEIASTAPHLGTMELAYRSLGAIFNVCCIDRDERTLNRLETKMMEAYTKVYDRTGRREALDLAAAMAEKAAATRMFATEEYDGVLYVMGGVYRRLAEAGDSEEHANRALTVLSEALTARTAEASPADHGCIKGEIGQAYLALAKAKNPVKAYKSAAQAFEDAGRLLDAKTYPWDSALYRGKAACAYTFLADEYCRGRRYDDAIQSARSALALYPDVVKFFEKRSPEDFIEASSSMGFAHTIVSEVYLKSRMFDLSLKHAQNALGAYSSAAKAIDPKAMPERYAFLKTSIGQTHANMAEIHFREKRYENAIGACDSAIAAYNEAIRIYEEKGKDRPATAARKHLKKANELFSTMMRIGVAEKKPLAPVAEI